MWFFKKSALAVLSAAFFFCCVSSSFTQEVLSRIEWSFKTEGQIWGSSTTVNGVTYFGSIDGRVYALESATGAMRWRFQTAGPIFSQPTVYGNYMYVSSDGGFLYKLNTKDGSEIWRFNIHEETPGTRLIPQFNGRFDFFGSAPVEVDGIVYVGSADGRMYAVNAETSAKLWHFKTGDIVRSTPAISDSFLVFGSFDGQVYALNKNTGESIWSFNTTREVSATPAIYNGIVYIGSRNPFLYALALESGDIIWTKSYGTSFVEASAAVYDDKLYIGSSFLARAHALSLETGEAFWEVNLNGGVYSTPALTEDAYYTGLAGFFSPNNLKGAFVRLNRKTGEEMWRHAFSPVPNQQPIPEEFTYGVTGSPEVVDSMVLFGALDSVFYAFKERLKNIIAFNVEKNEVLANEEIVLSWQTLDGARATINGMPVAGTDSMTLVLQADSTFTLIATKDTFSDTASLSVDVLPAVELNRAKNKPAFSSSDLSSSVPASAAVDGDETTRWVSAPRDSEWIYVDLGAVYPVERVHLVWNSGYRATEYLIEISDNAENWTEVIHITNGSGQDDDLTGLNSVARFVRMFGITRSGTRSGFTLRELEVYEDYVTSVEAGEGGVLPEDFFLEQNYPNPFNPATSIGYTLARAGKVSLTIYDMLGKQVAKLVNEYQSSGRKQYTWNGTNSASEKVSSGIYIYRLKVDEKTQVKRMLLLK